MPKRLRSKKGTNIDLEDFDYKPKKKKSPYLH